MKEEQLKKVWSRLTDAERKEVDRLLKARTVPNVLSNAFDLQRAFIRDESKLKVLFSTRRAAKSYTAGLYLVKTALERPSTSSVYIGLTRDQSKRLIWNDILKQIIGQYDISAKFNETELTITFGNGSIIYVLGVDDSEAEKDKLLGKKYALAVIDEAASYNIDLKSLVFKVLKPAMSDLRGTICLVGTPDNKKAGIFYELTKDVQVSPASITNKDGWEIFSWSTFDNPFMKDQWQETINELKNNDPFVEEQAWFKQHYLGQWTVEDNNKIYRYNEDRNSWNGNLKDYGWKPWQYVLGIDLGYEDATALALLAWHENDPHVYIIRTDKHKNLTLTNVADWIREWMNDYHIGAFIVDGANKQAVEEMVRHHQLPLQAAEKSDKVSFIRIMNSDFVSGKIKVNGVECSGLIEEYDKTIWNKRFLEKGIYKEDSSFHPDIADAALYAYRFCFHYANTPADRRSTTEQQVEQQKREWNEEILRKQMERQFSIEGSEYLYDGII